MSTSAKKSRLKFSSPSDEISDAEKSFPCAIDYDSDLLDDADDAGFTSPDINLIENENDFIIELAAPGLESKDFKVEINDETLSVSVKNEEERKQENKNYKRKEFSYNSFYRSFKLPQNLLIDNIYAKYNKGILQLTLPKKETIVSKPVKEIKVS